MKKKTNLESWRMAYLGITLHLYLHFSTCVGQAVSKLGERYVQVPLYQCKKTISFCFLGTLYFQKTLCRGLDNFVDLLFRSNVIKLKILIFRQNRGFLPEHKSYDKVSSLFSVVF